MPESSAGYFGADCTGQLPSNGGQFGTIASAVG
jgi:hypothetical protein